MFSTLLVGVLFGLGLVISGMCRVSKVLGFLTLSSNWDPSLAFVMGVGVTMNLFTFRYIRNNMAKPKVAEKFIERPPVPLGARTFIGASLFGIGWGMGGLCPGPAMIDFFNANSIIIWIIGHCLSIVITDYYDAKNEAKECAKRGS